MTFEELREEARQQGFRLVRYTPEEKNKMKIFPNRGAPWKTTEEQALVALFKVGASPLQMSIKLGRTPASLLVRLSELGHLTKEGLGFTVNGKDYAGYSHLKVITKSMMRGEHL